MSSCGVEVSTIPEFYTVRDSHPPQVSAVYPFPLILAQRSEWISFPWGQTWVNLLLDLSCIFSSPESSEEEKESAPVDTLLSHQYRHRNLGNEDSIIQYKEGKHNISQIPLLCCCLPTDLPSAIT